MTAPIKKVHRLAVGAQRTDCGIFAVLQRQTPGIAQSGKWEIFYTRGERDVTCDRCHKAQG